MGFLLPAAATLAACSSLGVGATESPTAAKPAATASSKAKAPAPARAVTSASGSYVVTFGVATRSGRLSAVQSEATPRGERRWKKSGAGIACRNLSGSQMHACNDKGGGTLTCALVDLTGIATPKDLVACELRSSSPVSAADLSVKVIDASDPATKPVNVEVTVTKVRGG